MNTAWRLFATACLFAVAISTGFADTWEPPRPRVFAAEGGGYGLKVLEPQFVPFTFQLKGKNSSAKMGNAVSVEFEPIKNPVTGEPESIRIEHGTGFIFKSAECVSAKQWWAKVGELNFSWPGQSGFIAKIKYSN